MTYVKVSVAKPGSNKGAGGDKKDKIILFDFDDILTWPARDSKGVVVTENIVFNPGAYMITIYATTDKIKIGSNTEGDLDAEGFVQNLEFTHPGNENEIREFKSNWMSRNIGAIIERCSSTKKDLLGTPCAALKMVIKWEDDKDKNLTTFTFKSANKGPYDVADYQGTTTFDTVTGTVAAEATSANLAAGEGRYQLTTSASAAKNITTCTNPVNGGTYTFLGSGGGFPSTIDKGDDFILAGGVTWTALSGATLTFKAFKDDTSTWKFIEVSRS